MGIESVNAPGSVNAGETETSDAFNVADKDGQASMYWNTSGAGVIEVTLQGSLDGGSSWFNIEKVDGTTKKKQTEHGLLSSNSEGEQPKFEMLRLHFNETGGTDSKSIDDVKASY